MNKLKTGWLSPSGEFHVCGRYEHIDMAREIASAYPDYNCSGQPADTFIENKGWLGIHLSLLGNREWLVCGPTKITPEQRSFIEPYLHDYIEPSCSLKILVDYYDSCC